MSMYRLKTAVKQNNYCPVLSLGTFGEILSHLDDNVVGSWRHVIDAVSSGDTPLDGVPEWLSEVEGYSIEDAKRLILDFLGFTPTHSPDVTKLEQIPNFLLITSEEDDLLPINWLTKNSFSGESLVWDTPIQRVRLCGYNGPRHNDEDYLYYDQIQDVITDEFGLTDVLTMGDFWELPIDTQYDIVVKLLEYGPSDTDIYPGYRSEFFCNVLGNKLPFTTIYSDEVSTAPVTIFMQDGDEDKWVVLRLIKPTTIKDTFGFAGGFEILSENQEGELINEGFEIEASQIGSSSPGLYSAMCNWEFSDGGEPTTLERIYWEHSELRKYIERIPDPKPEPTYSELHKVIVDQDRSVEQFLDLFKGKEGMIASAFGGQEAYLLTETRIAKMKAFLAAVEEWSGLGPGDSEESWHLDAIPESITRLLYEKAGDNPMRTFLSRGWVILQENNAPYKCREIGDFEFFPLVGDSSDVVIVCRPGESDIELLISWKPTRVDHSSITFEKHPGAQGGWIDMYTTHIIKENNTRNLLELWQENEGTVWFDVTRISNNSTLNSDPRIIPSDFGTFFPIEVLDQEGNTVGYNVIGFSDDTTDNNLYILKPDEDSVHGISEPESSCGYWEFEEISWFRNDAMTKEEFLEAYPEYAYLFPKIKSLEATKRNKIIAF